MRTVFIFHGTGGSPEENWFPLNVESGWTKFNKLLQDINKALS